MQEWLHIFFLLIESAVCYCRVPLSSFIMLLRRWLLCHNMLCLNMLKYQRTERLSTTCPRTSSLGPANIGLDANKATGVLVTTSLATTVVCCYRCWLLHKLVVWISQKIESTLVLLSQKIVGHMPKSIFKSASAKLLKNTQYTKSGKKVQIRKMLKSTLNCTVTPLLHHWNIWGNHCDLPKLYVFFRFQSTMIFPWQNWPFHTYTPYGLTLHWVAAFWWRKFLAVFLKKKSKNVWSN